MKRLVIFYDQMQPNMAKDVLSANGVHTEIIGAAAVYYLLKDRLHLPWQLGTH